MFYLWPVFGMLFIQMVSYNNIYCRDQRYEVAISKEAFECINKHLKVINSHIVASLHFNLIITCLITVWFSM